MTTHPVPAPAAKSGPPKTATPAHVAMAVLHLGAVGVFGFVVFTATIVLFAVGLALTPVLGIGLVLLLGLVYVLYGVAWAETARVDGLYGLGLPPLEPRRREADGFGGFVRTVLRQAIEPRMWRALANLAVATMLGGFVLFLFRMLVRSAVISFAPLVSPDPVRVLFTLSVDAAWAPVWGIAGVLVAAAGIIGLAVLHGLIARAIVVPSREAQLAAQARTSDAQRAGAVRASEVERTRIERDLHDGVQPRLVSVGMTLGLAQQKIDDDPVAARALIEEAHTSTKTAITELRQLARGIHASVLDDRGLDAALSALAGRSHIPVHLDVRMDGPCSREAEAALYFSIAESLTNAAKHSRASECRVVVRRRDDGTLWARVEDNGMGGARILPGGGLDGISNRVAAAGGTSLLVSPAGGPTSLEVSVPCAS
jgi:signal transduction histidine kinase